MWFGGTGHLAQGKHQSVDFLVQVYAILRRFCASPFLEERVSGEGSRGPPALSGDHVLGEHLLPSSPPRPPQPGVMFWRVPLCHPVGCYHSV